jgi:hypothetical protein
MRTRSPTTSGEVVVVVEPSLYVVVGVRVKVAVEPPHNWIVTDVEVTAVTSPPVPLLA